MAGQWRGSWTCGLSFLLVFLFGEEISPNLKICADSFQEGRDRKDNLVVVCLVGQWPVVAKGLNLRGLELSPLLEKNQNWIQNHVFAVSLAMLLLAEAVSCLEKP